ncbi:peptidoglycan DD-metalloendopeptidase family protein [Cellulomonas sp. DKR-3]|uniref:Peptidoglycan DD-metalloendopeptidase family protein n=1 Tax=Cellulomonas fulva TaxID=2835530 RepID=A0ABS5U2V1_9CELL|nr:M23 family metallopeptidase [Cellulomonas fulva]MBT0995725.1 peptidoglycan DD-metalloendopeptidase family protein [Cellulomonas fulva]
MHPSSRSRTRPPIGGPAVPLLLAALLLAVLLLAALPLVGIPAAGAAPAAGATLETTARATAGPLRAGPGTAVSSYRLPVADAAVLRAFEAPPEPWAAGHRGVDLAADVRTRVGAPAAGVVTFAGAVAGRGVVTVRHDDGLWSSLEPVDAAVAVGDRVDPGHVLGALTAGGHCAASPCLHWGVRTGPDAYVDPMSLVDPSGLLVLLPP